MFYVVNTPKQESQYQKKSENFLSVLARSVSPVLFKNDVVPIKARERPPCDMLPVNSVILFLAILR